MKTQFLKALIAFLIFNSTLLISANAQIVYTDVNPDSTLTAGSITSGNYKTFQLDINNDGIKDFNISVKHWGKASGYNYANIKPLNGNEISGYTNWNGASQFILGASITNSSHWISDSSYLKWRCWTSDVIPCGTDKGLWVNDSIRYLGLKIISGSNNYFGWLRIKIKIGSGGFNMNQFTIYDYAYNPIPNQPILAGETSCANPTVNLTQSGPLSFCAGDSVTLTANGTGYQYQWKKGGVNISGATSKTYIAKTAGTYKCKVTNSCGSDTSGTRTVTVPCRNSNYNFGEELENLLVYPNPATNSIIIKFPSDSDRDDEPGKIQIVNLFGQIVFSEKINEEQTQIDVSKFSAGMYIVKWSSRENSETKTLTVILQH